MSLSLDRLYELLPVVHRMRDAERNYPLRALLRVINEQVNVVEDDIAQLYENWFIETCEDWVVPYIGDLIGYRPVHEAGDSSVEADSPQGRSRNHMLIPRREVANTLGFRRRKGTLSLLEVLANDVAGWPARAVGFYALLGWQQHLNHQRLSQARTVNLRNGLKLDLVDGPFDPLAHSVDVRRTISHRSLGRYNIPSVGVFIWRLKVYSVTHAPAYCLETAGPQCFTFSVLGHDTPLYTKAEPETEPKHIADEINLPIPIRRRSLEQRISLRPLKTQVSGIFYGESESLVIYAPDWPTKNAPQPVPAQYVIPADLSDWRYRAHRGQIAVDPVRGRIAFPTGQLPKRGVWVTYHYAFSANMGGGEYDRPLSRPVAFSLYSVTKDKPEAGTFATINAAFKKWRQDQQDLGPEPGDPTELEKWLEDKERLRAAVIEIQDSGAYSEPIAIELEAGESLQLRAANRTRPVIRLLDYMTEHPDAFTVSGKRASRFTLDGILVTGRGMQVVGPDRNEPERFAEGDLCDVTLRHVTLVPGWGIECDCEPRRPNEPSLELLYTGAKITIEHSIIGSIEVVADEAQTDPVEIAISDSIVDATSESRTAIGAANLPLAFAQISILRSTVIGEVNTHAILLAENTIFMSHLMVGRRQLGCIRYCYVTQGSRTPRRHRCQSETAEQAAEEMLLTAPRQVTDPPLTDAMIADARQLTRTRVRPRFTSTRYGTPAYCQLACDCATEIKRGADDESEMGAFHDLYQPQREANLRVRLEEYTPAGMEAGILFVN
ncbi:hypothetical protein EDC63_106102 [Sulfurirhabdus autotrophica]|uniref:Uncharacterized protein n=2 Tax=Sulfurirhabdus autotrophica TaxID=1706046 RepID=A0A4R3Y5L6_9PROT|nr:hypothetical protein EDC63_106102 [Sulfurirhabdus autotrophica]